MAFLCVSQQGGFKNAIKKPFGKGPCQKLFAKKLMIKKTVFLSFVSFDFFYRVLGRFSA
jgi:hypothetical protein